jgi:hypothetical protein
MKYVVTWEPLPTLTEETAKRSLAVFSKWSPTHPEHFQAFLGRMDGYGGFAVVETDDPTELAKDTSPFTVWFRFQIHPCLEIADMAAIQTEALAFAESIG